MKNKPSTITAASLLASLLVFSLNVNAQPPVLQRGYDAGVTGATLSETKLNTTNVSPSTFGLVFKLPVDDAIFAQPLYVPNLLINQTSHNVLYVATMSDTVYAFDADTGGAPLWTLNLASLVGAKPVPVGNFVFSGSHNIVGNLGILSTPVIDLSTHTLYVVSCTLEGVTPSTPNGTMVYRLHALDITTGARRAGSGLKISGSHAGLTFNGRYHWQRESLVLSGNHVVFGFGPVELEYAGEYVGWVMAYDKSTLAQTGVFATVTTGNGGGGVWQSGRPAVVDSSGFVYLFVGNAFGSGYDGVDDFSESALKLDPANGLKLIDWFTPSTWSTLDTQDLDLGSSGPLLIPGTNLLAGGGKAGVLYVLNTANLGKYNAQDSQIVQKAQIATEFRGGPVYWQRSAANGGPRLYNWGINDTVKAFPFNGTTFATTPSSRGIVTNQVFPGGILTLSANGDTPGSGVLWATTVGNGADAEDHPPVPGILYAFDAGNVAKELWNSTMNASRDGFGNYAKFVPPMVANGRVYVATWSNQVAVYGLTNTAMGPAPTLTGISPNSGPSGGGTIVTLTGTNFVSGATVNFAGVPAVVTSVKATTITAKTPVHSKVTVNVVVKNPDGQSATLVNGFTFT